MDVTQGREYVLTLSCPDKPGIVYAVSSFLVQHSANILASQQYGEESPDDRFFMVLLVLAPDADSQKVLDTARAAGPVEHFSFATRRLSEVFRDVTGEDA